MKKFKHFVLGTLFDIHPTNAYKITNKDLYAVTGNTPVLSNSSINNGIGGYCGLEPTESGNMITFSDTTTGADTMFYQPDPFIGYPHVQGLYVKGNHKWCEKEYLYLISVVRRAAGKGWSYSNKFTRKFVSELKVLLPVKDNLLLDVGLMSEIIGGINMSNIDTASWKEFRLVDIARLDNGNKMDKNKMTHLNPSVNFVSRTATNNGVSDVVDIIDGIEPYPAGCITLAFGGSVGSCFLQEEPFYTGQNVGVILLPENITRETKIFLISVLEKKCKMSFHAFGNEINKHFKTDLSIKLPVKEVEEIDWDYMQERITELEQERITELEQYLIATGLNDYELTDEDKEILATKLTGGVLQNSISGNGCLKEAAEFKISDVFDLYKGKRLVKAEHICGNTPFIGSTDSNNGVTGYIGQEPIFSGNAITISYNGSVGQVFYQENDFWASDDINVLYLKNHVLNASLYSYLSGALKKAGSKFSYSYKWNLERMKGTLIVLPIQTDANNAPVIDQNHTYHPDGYIPDWIYMEKYIRAIEKVVIKDVVDYKDSIIAKTKEIVA